MDETMQHMGRLLLILGAVVALIGAALIFLPKLPWLGRLPGDIVCQRKNVTFYFPLATSILVSIILTFFFWLFGKR